MYLKLLKELVELWNFHATFIDKDSKDKIELIEVKSINGTFGLTIQTNYTILYRKYIKYKDLIENPFELVAKELIKELGLGGIDKIIAMHEKGLLQPIRPTQGIED